MNENAFPINEEPKMSTSASIALGITIGIGLAIAILGPVGKMLPPWSTPDTPPVVQAIDYLRGLDNQTAAAAITMDFWDRAQGAMEAGKQDEACMLVLTARSAALSNDDALKTELVQQFSIKVCGK